jgi:hypothetical protein
MLFNDFKVHKFQGFLPVFAVFSIFKGITRPAASGIKFPGFYCFPLYVGTLTTRLKEKLLNTIPGLKKISA